MAYKSLSMPCPTLGFFLVIISVLSSEKASPKSDVVAREGQENRGGEPVERSGKVWAMLPKHIKVQATETVSRPTAKSPTVPRSVGIPPDRVYSRLRPRKHRRESDERRLRYLQSQFNRYRDGRTHPSTALLYRPLSVTPDCPEKCVCKDLHVSCHKAELEEIPKDIPKHTERLSITGNRILHLSNDAFKGLPFLKSLILANNQIQTIDVNAFAGITQLRRLRVDHNNVRQLPPAVFANLSQLHRLDLQANRLECIPTELLGGLPELRYLYLTENRLSWISPNTFRYLSKLKYIDLHGNPFHCDCHLQKMIASIHMKSMTFADNQPFGVCTMQVNGRSLEYPINKELLNLFHCPADAKWLSPPTKTLEDCLARETREDSCESVCDCSLEKTVNCQHQGLRKIPQDLPEDMVEINLSHNQMESLPELVFNRYKRLRKIILDNNKLTEVTPRAFEGLNELSSLYMSSNGLTHLPTGLFDGLKGLKILYLHQNQISCIQRETFKGLENLQILHLSNNQIRSFPSDCFSDLKKLKYLYLVNNPIICDCRVQWLPAYLVEKEAGGAQWVDCAEPAGLRGHRIRDVSPQNLRCTALTAYSQGYQLSTCGLTTMTCPKECTCQELTSQFGDPLSVQVPGSSPHQAMVHLNVDCSNLGLSEIPTDIPGNTRQLNLGNNRLTEITSNSVIANLGHLETLILDNNRIQHIEQSAFAHNPELKKLIVSNNSLTNIDHRVLSGLKRLEILLLQHNQLSCLSSQTFSRTPSLKILMLNNNKLRCLAKGLFDAVSLDSLSLSANPLTCDCHLSWLPDWLREQVAMEPLPPTCVEPEDLAGTPVGSLSRYHFTCAKRGQAVALGWLRRRSLGGVEKEIGDFQNDCCDESAETDKDEEVGGDNGCPKHCLCDATSVYCSDLNLTQIPLHIPVETRQLYLERNRISQILPERLEHLVKLHTLVLSYNQLSELQGRLFENLVNLKTLVLSHNNIQCIHQEAFKGLRALRVLILQTNNISSIPYGAFQDLRQLNNIALGQNPLHCDCNGKWLNSFFRQHFLDNGIALCHSPAGMKHKSIYHSRPSDFVCPWKQRWRSTSHRHHHRLHDNSRGDVDDEEDDNQTTVSFRHTLNASSGVSNASPTGLSGGHDEQESLLVAARCAPCLVKPCAHGGLCTPIGQLDYRCSCSSSYRGKQCELFEDACGTRPCHNGGVCEVSSDNTDSYRCICPAGFRGVNCAEKIETCRENVCLNGGVCEMVGEAHRCHCPTGYHGKNCENAFKFCNELNPCVNGGRCISQSGNKYRCECVRGWSGKNCDLNEDDCLYNKCENGASCVDGINEYICKCRPGYAGMFCEQSTWNPAAHVTRMDKNLPSHFQGFGGNRWQSLEVRHSPIKTRSLTTPRLESLCAYHQCQNKAVCQENQNNLYSCQCPPGFSGQFCEHLTSVSLPSPHSYVAIVPPSRGALVPRGSISLLVSTRDSDGVLVYYGDMLQTSDDRIPEQYLLVYLTRGHLHVHLALNATSRPTKRQSIMQVNTGVQHKIELIVEQENVTLLVDNSEQPTGALKGGSNGGSMGYHSNHLALNYPLYFGGAPADRLDVAGRILKQSQTFGIRGCIQDIRINKRIVDLAKLFGAPVDKLLAADTQNSEKPSPEARYHGTAIGIVPGCPSDASPLVPQLRNHLVVLRGTTSQSQETLIFEPRSQGLASTQVATDVCSGNASCHNGGRCQNTWINGSLVGYTCICPAGYTGRLCQRAIDSSCQAVGQRSYFRDPKTNCFSARKLRMRSCAGGCERVTRIAQQIMETTPRGDFGTGRYLFKRHGDAEDMGPLNAKNFLSVKICCQSSKVKYRKIRFVCSNNSNYEKTLRFVKQCACLPCSTQPATQEA